ncbi:MAG: hypothetical protein JXR71_04415 [Bacteroidales bacterium]|nr:hypothetical protein [Bacteroidales bacterium]
MSQYNQIGLNEEIDFTTGSAVLHESGSLKLWLRKEKNYLEMVSVNNPGSKSKTPPPKSLWKKWMVSEDPVKLSFLPHVPDLPVQIAFPEPLIVPAGKTIQFYYWLPSWISVRLGKQQDLSLGEFPSQPMSHTWMGNFFDGELVYEDFPAVHFSPEFSESFIFICPVEVKNKAAESLVLEKMLIRVNNLSVYSDGNYFWLNKMIFDYGKGNELLDVRLPNALPKDLGKFTLVAKAINPDRKSLLLKTFTPILMKNTLILPNK